MKNERKAEDGTVLVSVVVPVWNPGEGILKCIASLRAQTLRQIEMIFVDDRGTARAVDHIRAAAAEDPRIRLLVNPENRGPGYARNVGIKAARGEYISFVDPDDYVAYNFLERLYAMAVRDDLDIVKGRIVYEKEDGTVAPHPELNDRIRAGLRTGKPLYPLFSYEHHSAIYRREMLTRSGARYGLARRSQDTTFLLRACHAARSSGLDDEAVYCFRERGNSTMHRFDLATLEQMRFSFQEQVDYLSTALAADPHAPFYAVSLFLSYARFFTHYLPTPENETARQAFCAGLREQVLRLPYADRMKQACFPVRALLDHGALLSPVPGFLPWETPSAADWLALLSRWVDYIRTNPRDAKPLSGQISRICKRADQKGKEEHCQKQVRACIRKELKKLSFLTRARIRCLEYSVK